MTERKLVAVRLEPKHIKRLSEMATRTGWSQSEVIRRLIEDASVTPAKIVAGITEGKGVPLAVVS